MEPNSPKRGEFFWLRPDTTRPGRGHGVVFENVKELLTPPRLILRPEGGGFPHLASVPRLVYSPKKGDPPEDLEGGMSGYWLVSERLKLVFEQVDPDGFQFVECDYRAPDGSALSPYYLCEVARVLDAVDEGASTMQVLVSDEYPTGKIYDLTGGASLAFRKDVIGQAHVFHTPFSGSLTFCDRHLRNAVWSAGIGGPEASRGLRFKDAADI